MKRKLLVIEDETSVAKQLRWGLNQTYDVTIAADAAQARPLLASGAFPVATLDLGLPPYPDTPRMGFDLLREIPALSPHTRVIVITGNAEAEHALQAVSLGAVDFYAKPIDLKTSMLNAKANMDAKDTGAEAMDIPALIVELGALHDQGLLTDAEFSQKKADLLAKLE